MAKTKNGHAKKNSSSKKKSPMFKTHLRAFLRTYIPIVVVIGFALFLNNTWLANIHDVLGATTNISPNGLLSDTNIQRVQYGENPLKINPYLAKAAQTKADNMVALNYWSHYTPSGQPPWVFITNAGYKYKSAGENLAYGFNSSGAILNAWMHSPEHRANILDGNYQNVGFGIATSPDYRGQGPQTVIVAMYGQPASAVTTIYNNAASVSINAPPVVSISRAQLIIGNYSSLIEILIVLATGLLGAAIVLRHGIKWKRALMQGEEFIVSHPILDIATTCLIMAGVLFSVTAGYIG